MVATILVRRIDGKVQIGGVPRFGRSAARPAAARRSIGFVLEPSRPVPRVGAQARIAHFGGGFERGTVIAVHEQGRRLRVRGEGGEVLEFVLSPATARFVSAARAHGPRLELLGDGA
jgi:hypothetical protein